MNYKEMNFSRKMLNAKQVICCKIMTNIMTYVKQLLNFLEIMIAAVCYDH